MFSWWPFKRRAKALNINHADLVKIAEGSANPLKTLRSLHLKALHSKDADLLLATTTGLGVMQGMSQAAERMGNDRREMVEMFAAVVYAAGGEVVVRPEHSIQIPYLVLVKELSPVDGSVTWHAGSRQ